MRFTPALAVLLAAAPFAALGDVSYSRATVMDTRPAVPDSLRVCADRNDTLWDRKALLDADMRDLDRESERIAGMKAQLARDFSGLDSRDVAAVERYNQRSADLNRSVEAYNRRVAEANGASALLNRDSAEMVAYCNRLTTARR